MSGLFQARAYTKANREVAKQRLDALEHFVDEGWRRLRNPSREFDVWWYWTEYLDPAADDVDPLLHYALVGRRLGHEPLPPVEVATNPVSFVPEQEPRRICLFAGYDPHGVVDDYVVAYVTELSRFADVYYLADGYLKPGELDKLAHVTKGAWAKSHGAYDFGSYSMLARDLVGWDVIDGYDELVLVNDSGFLIRPLDGVFAEMDRRTCDWWGLQATRHDFVRHSNGGEPLPLADAKATMIGERTMDDMDHLHVSSYFLAFRARVHRDRGFRRRLDAVTRQSDKHLVIYKYEIGLSRYLMCRGFEVDTFIPDLYPFHPLYTEQYFDLLAMGFPLLKRNFLSENSRDVPDLARWKDRISAEVPDAHLEVLERNLARVSPDDRLRRSFSLTVGDSGELVNHRPLSWWHVAEQDRLAPMYDHWWAFPVDVTTGHLSSDQRAVFEQVRHDPAVRKVILSREARVDLDGENVQVVPLRSAEGQDAAFRSRTFFLAQTPRVSVPFPISPRRHRFVLVSAAARLEQPARVVADKDTTTAEDAARLTLVVASSHHDALAAAAFAGVVDQSRLVVSGAPRHDLLLRELDDLPPDLRAEETRVRDAAGARRLMLFLPHAAGRRLVGDRGPSSEELARLVSWCEQHDYVLGYQDRPGDRHRRLSQVLEPLGALAFDRHEHPLVEPLLRAADVVVTDGADAALEATLLRRRVVLLNLPASRESFLLPPATALAGPRTLMVDTLTAFLDSVDADPGLLETPDQGGRSGYDVEAFGDTDNAARLVRLVREGDVSLPPVSA
ncbi:rhamnan synthesis F family protein [Nocardioides iriomotensis]|uniref:Uncharacterized protein n=1 Tax=Nocardioides iriomotensis TaxID=715784 RepID=A0A4Q5J9S8_9ACTN|nr:rhamnan synthesis F family protein [Nocardioides iriomotensis]RYU14495.1 hypothetical protein ETU37_02905 [Nocardioides iriomotensis]